MKTFYEFLENTNSVRIDIDPLKKILINKLKEFFGNYNAETEQLKNFKLDLNFVKDRLKEYPKLNQLLTNLQTNPKNDSWYKDLVAWQRSLPPEKYMDAFEVVRYLYKYIDSLDSNRNIDEKQYYEYLDQVLEKTNKNMLELKNKIDQAIMALNWNGSQVVITPIYSQSEEDFLSPSNSAEILVGNKKGIFQYWVIDEKATIEDILEPDEEESQYFFTNNEEKQDYFNLIQELQNPGSVRDKILTLYTARPVKDREFYSKTDYLPANVFLSNNFSHVDGLAGDLAGTEERRDIYKVKINSKYLVKTLDGPVKYYMVIKDSPIESINLY